MIFGRSACQPIFTEFKFLNSLDIGELHLYAYLCFEDHCDFYQENAIVFS